MSVATPDLPQDSVPVTLRSSGGGHSRRGNRTCARWPGPSAFPGPRGPGKRRAVSTSLPPPAEGRQCRGSCPRPGERRAPRPDWNSTQDIRTRGDSRVRGCSCPRYRGSSGRKSPVGRLTILLLSAGAGGLVSPWETFCNFYQSMLMHAQSLLTLCQPSTITFQALLSMGFSRQEH